MRRALIALIAALALTGCGADEVSTGATKSSKPHQPAFKTGSRGLAEQMVEPSHCPSGHPACRETVGRIVYVERVDPDGDGDAHFVIRDPQGITLRGLTAIDVRVGLRPHPLPGPGDLVSAAGPVQTGSYGQSQIHALELHVGR